MTAVIRVAVRRVVETVAVHQVRHPPGDRIPLRVLPRAEQVDPVGVHHVECITDLSANLGVGEIGVRLRRWRWR